MASSLIGMYAFAIADSQDAGNPRLVLGRDRLGIKPLAWAETAEGIVFGSEVKCLLASGMVEREMRREALLTTSCRATSAGRRAHGPACSASSRNGVDLEREGRGADQAVLGPAHGRARALRSGGDP